MKNSNKLILGSIGIAIGVVLYEIRKKSIHTNAILNSCTKLIDYIEEKCKYFYNNNLFKDENERKLFDSKVTSVIQECEILMLRGLRKSIFNRNKYYIKALYKLTCLSAKLQSNDLGWLYN